MKQTVNVVVISFDRSELPKLALKEYAKGRTRGTNKGSIPLRTQIIELHWSAETSHAESYDTRKRSTWTQCSFCGHK